ncbi:hypothetical protein Back11_41400 [Paenibacillus baekrokdamisoli]|uniref:Signal peptidase I n=1 Tax=Paenibacillus baekrokdamisoli TaxID=1712516 RepID=A0A3G9J372_9BACL|nr:signal peptidase I [Paenibacillus baekrokdamisoli]MBB3068160.1 signal peptidase I [Paenibacillus baekrokdamisoli]BBH22795.1 hypothetical protein Back11_41400 [Paenibacillus baekrokdamisoli]
MNKAKFFRSSAVVIIGIIVAVIVAVIVLWLMVFKEETITDSYTPLTLEKAATTSGKLIYDYYNDGMAGKQSDYSTGIVGSLVIDMDVYKSQRLKRGDVILFRMPPIDLNINNHINPPETSVARVIALPGEKIGIKKGQIYINDKKLDTYYGRVLMWGQDEKTFFANSTESSCPKECVEGMTEYFNTSMNEITIPQGHIYILGDSMGRSIDSQTFGSLPLINVKGKVIGVTGQPKLI